MKAIFFSIIKPYNKLEEARLFTGTKQHTVTACFMYNVQCSSHTFQNVTYPISYSTPHRELLEM